MDFGHFYFWIGCVIIPYWLASKLNSATDKVSKVMIACLLYSLAFTSFGYIAFNFVLFGDLLITTVIGYFGIQTIVIADRLVKRR